MTTPNEGGEGIDMTGMSFDQIIQIIKHTNELYRQKTLLTNIKVTSIIPIRKKVARKEDARCRVISSDGEVLADNVTYDEALQYCKDQAQSVSASKPKGDLPTSPDVNLWN